MSEKYRLTILSPMGNNGVASATTCFEVLSNIVYDEFKKLDHVDVCIERELKRETDFIIFTGYAEQWISIHPLKETKAKVKAKKLVSLLECKFIDADWSFCFQDSISSKPNHTVFYAPCSKQYYTNVPKEKSVLIDHCWVAYFNSEREWSERISEWLKDIKDEYKIYKLIRNNDEWQYVKPYEIPISHLTFLEYLKATNSIETYIVSHHESYSYGVIDMVARGIRVIQPPALLPINGVADYFTFPVFNNKEEMIKLIKSPVEPVWNSLIDKCTDYSEIVKGMDQKFREWNQ